MTRAYLFLVLLAAALMVGCSTNTAHEQATLPNEVSNVATTEVLLLQPGKTILLPGELYPWNKVAIYSKVKGFVKTLNVDRGSEVRKGEVLAILDAPEVLTEFDQAKGHLFAAEATYSQSKAKAAISRLMFTRLSEVSKTKGAVSLHELDQARTQLLSDSAALASSV